MRPFSSRVLRISSSADAELKLAYVKVPLTWSPIKYGPVSITSAYYAEILDGPPSLQSLRTFQYSRSPVCDSRVVSRHLSVRFADT